jgi:ketosteroid isomerase-like protein
MPWFPDFVAAVELARRQTRTAGLADPIAQYFTALEEGDARALEKVWPGRVVIYDPRAGEVQGHRQLRRFVHRNRLWLGERHATTESVASTCSGSRAVVEILAHLVADDGEAVGWPLAVVAESVDDRSVVFRTYCSQRPMVGEYRLRPAILEQDRIDLNDVVGRYQVALGAGDIDAIVATFAPDGYVREPLGPSYSHRGSSELRSYFARCFSGGGGIALQKCCVTDDGVRSALEYNCVKWGATGLPPQAGIAVFERGPDGLLAAVRIYDDVEPPV